MSQKIIGTAIALLIILFILNRLFPEKLDMTPVLESAKESYYDIKSTLKEITKDEEINTDVPVITDIPVIELQSDRQPANKSNISEEQNGQGANRSYSVFEHYRKEVEEKPRTNHRKPKEDNPSNPCTLGVIAIDDLGNINCVEIK